MRTAKFASLLLASLISSGIHAKTFQVYYLGGQSNMVGFGFNQDLPPSLVQTQTTVPIFSGAARLDGDPNGGEGTWTLLKPGLGLNADFVDGNYVYSDRFGPELSFAAEMQHRRPQENIAIIKYAWGGTALVDGVSAYGSWDPSVAKTNQFDYFLKTVHSALSTKDIDGDGTNDTLVPAGIVWMQGEADAFDNAAAANAYLANLTRLMGLLRAALHNNRLPVVIGRITDSKSGQANPVMAYADIVRRAQQAYTLMDQCAVLSTVTEDLTYGEGDDWHYDSAGYIAMGTDFARKLAELQTHCPTRR